MFVSHRDRVAAYQTKDTSTIRELLHPQQHGVKAQSLAEATVAVGAVTQEHYHRLSEEIYYVLRGEGFVRVGDDEAVIRDGDAVVIPPGMRHCILNIGHEELVFLCCCSPAYSHDDTVLCEDIA